MSVPGNVTSAASSSPQRSTTVTTGKARRRDNNGVDDVLKYFLQRASKHPDDSSSNTSLLDKCLEKVLPICNGQGDNQIASSDMKSALKTYTEAATETGMYTPFTDTTRAALECLRGLEIDGMRHPDDEMEIAFQQNHRTVFTQNRGQKTSHRKPDVVVVVNKLANRSEEARDDGSYVEDQANGTKDKSKIYWRDVFSIVEFKRRKPTKPPPPSYVILHRTDLDDLQAEMAEGVQSDKSTQAPGPGLKRPSEDDLVERLAKRSKNHSTSAKPPVATKPGPRAQIRAALYAAELLSANVMANYVIIFTVRDDEIWIWMYDHQGVIGRGGFNFVKDLPRFMVLLFALQRFRSGEWGRSTDFKVHGHVYNLQLTNPARVPTPDQSTPYRLLVFHKLQPITELQPKPEEVFDVWVQCILCHYALWKCNVHHRDISTTNLMYYRVNGTLKGVLKDYDRTTMAGSEGTIPFMAIDLLGKDGKNGKVEHRYRHDVESMVWVFIWVSCQYKDGKFRTRYFGEWADLGASQCAEAKQSSLFSFEQQIPYDLTTTVRRRVIHFASGIDEQLSFREERKRKLANLLGRMSWLLGFSEDGTQASILQLKTELREKDDDEVFREFAELIGLEDVDAVIQLWSHQSCRFL